MARTKIKEAPVLKTWEDVDKSLKEIAEKEIRLEEIEGEMNKQINGIKIAAALEAKPHQDRIDKLGKDIKEFVTEHKEEIEGKTRVLNFGKTGFRLSTTLSLPSAKDKLEKIINKLRKRKMEDCIIVKESVNKEVLKKYDEEVIIEIGGTLKKTDTFWYETDREKIQATQF